MCKTQIINIHVYARICNKQAHTDFVKTCDKHWNSKCSDNNCLSHHRHFFLTIYTRFFDNKLLSRTMTWVLNTYLFIWQIIPASRFRCCKLENCPLFMSTNFLLLERLFPIEIMYAPCVTLMTTPTRWRHDLVRKIRARFFGGSAGRLPTSSDGEPFTTALMLSC